MFRRSNPIPATSPQLPVALDQPHDTCFRCGRATPPGVSLCEIDNPGHIKGPSATQVHGTVAIGVLFGFVGLLFIFRLAAPGGAAAFSSALSGVATRADGGVDVVITVTNTGSGAAAASCAVAPGGIPNYQDYVFFTGPIPAGETRTFTRTLTAPRNGTSLSAGSVAIRCI